MSHSQRHRGAHPEDAYLFADVQLPKVRNALQDYCWLLSKGYSVPSSLKLVGDKFQLVDRQRLLLMRSACTDAQRLARQGTERPVSAIAGCDLYLDGFNVLIAVESALSHGFLFVGQDGCYRDLASVHGTYKRVLETDDAIRLIGNTLHKLQVGRVFWLLDKPVSNSGRLRQMLLETSQQNGWDWEIELFQSPDEELKQITGTVVTTDSVILDSVRDWFHLNQQVVDSHIPNVQLINLRPDTLLYDSMK